jgi:mono/diheme cytochrome c family protein
MMNGPVKFFFLWRTFVILALAPLLLWTGVSAFAENDSVGRGKKVFEGKCSPCHTIGGGRKVGPDLKGITEERQRVWLEAFISDPEKMFSSNDPIATGLLNQFKIKMPVLGLSKDDVSAVIDFLGSQESALQTSAPARGAPPGDAGEGKRLFTGSTAFKKGGAHCIACHSVNGIGFLGGGTLGPDLTNVYSVLGDGIASTLTNIPFPTMVPVFKEHPLTPEEARDLTAFFKGIAASAPQNFTPWVLITVLIDFLVLMLVIWFIWRHRLLSVREKMVESSRNRGKTR